MKKIDFTKLNSANVSCDNSVDTERVYDIKANANLQGDNLSSMDSGVVMKGDVQVATFNMWGENFNPSFNNVSDVMEMCAILTAITTFIANVKSELVNNPIEI
jgi:hypothetical protein